MVLICGLFLFAILGYEHVWRLGYGLRTREGIYLIILFLSSLCNETLLVLIVCVCVYEFYVFSCCMEKGNTQKGHKWQHVNEAEFN